MLALLNIILDISGEEILSKYCKSSLPVCLCGFGFCCWSFICCDKNLHAQTEPESSQYIYTAVKISLAMPLGVNAQILTKSLIMFLW